MKSTLGVGLGILLDALLPLVRLIALAHLLPQEEFGLAVTVLVTIGIVEMSSDIGLPQSAVRGSQEIAPAPFMGTLHSLAVLRSGVMITLALIALTIQGMTLKAHINTHIVLLAVLVLGLRSAENLNLKKLTREYNFWREAMLLGGLQVVWTAVTISSALVAPSAASMFHGMLAGALWVAVYSNLMSADPWRLIWDKGAAREALKFGAPLSPNGIASAFVTSDRLIVSNFLGTKQVAIYGVAVGLATLPRAVLWRFSVSVLVPHFANLIAKPDQERRFYSLWLLAVSAIASLYGLLLMLLGPWAIGLLFGAKYVPSHLLMSLIAVNVFIKFMMLVPLPASYARGQTSVVFLGSLVSALATIPAALTLFFGMRSLETFVLALNVFECMGLIWFLYHTTRLHGLRQGIALAAIAAPLLALGSLTAAAWTHQ
ncbi:MAG: oligosaccharide flippase family protein [Hyphomicrobiaceae bacterium]